MNPRYLHPDAERLICVPGAIIELERTPCGGWRSVCTSWEDPDSTGGGSGKTLKELACAHPWVAERLVQRIVELEDAIAVLRGEKP